MLVLTWILGIALVVSAVALGVTVRLLSDARREVERLQETAESQLTETRNARAARSTSSGRSVRRNHSRELRRTPITVRIGLHTGTAIERAGDYLGQNVALAARVAAQAQGGEILVTGEIAEDCSRQFDFTPAGSVELKGFEGEHALWRVEGRR